MQLQVLRHHLWREVHRRDSTVPGDRCKEHLKGPSPIHAHIQHTGQNATSDNFNIIGREDRDLDRTIKEAIYIRVNNPSLNRNVGKYHLSHLWESSI